MKKVWISIILLFFSASSQTIKQIFSSNEFCRRNAYPVYPNPDGSLANYAGCLRVDPSTNQYLDPTTLRVTNLANGDELVTIVLPNLSSSTVEVKQIDFISQKWFDNDDDLELVYSVTTGTGSPKEAKFKVYDYTQKQVIFTGDGFETQLYVYNGKAYLGSTCYISTGRDYFVNYYAYELSGSVTHGNNQNVPFSTNNIHSFYNAASNRYMVELVVENNAICNTKIFNLSGQTIFNSEKYNVKPGKNIFHIPLSGLSSGPYISETTVNNKAVKSKFIMTK